MKTVVYFVKHGGRNALWTRSMRRVGFIDDRALKDGSPQPAANEYWLVDIVRENLTPTGGVFVLKPLVKVETVEHLIHGAYDLDFYERAAILTPRAQGYWVMSSGAKQAILAATEVDAVVINHGGDPWPRRASADVEAARQVKQVLT